MQVLATKEISFKIYLNKLLLNILVVLLQDAQWDTSPNSNCCVWIVFVDLCFQCTPHSPATFWFWRVIALMEIFTARHSLCTQKGWIMPHLWSRLHQGFPQQGSTEIRCTNWYVGQWPFFRWCTTDTCMNATSSSQSCEVYSLTCKSAGTTVPLQNHCSHLWSICSNFWDTLHTYAHIYETDKIKIFLYGSIMAIENLYFPIFNSSLFIKCWTALKYELIIEYVNT